MSDDPIQDKKNISKLQGGLMLRRCIITIKEKEAKRGGRSHNITKNGSDREYRGAC